MLIHFKLEHYEISTKSYLKNITYLMVLYYFILIVVDPNKLART
jgi:hypothetical protein